MYKIAVVGDKESILGFSAIGMDIYPAYEEAEVKTLFPKLIEEKYAIIYITEDLSIKSEKYLEKYKKNKTPAIITIPSSTANLKYGQNRIKDMVQKAVGIEINFKESNS